MTYVVENRAYGVNAIDYVHAAARAAAACAGVYAIDATLRLIAHFPRR